MKRPKPIKHIQAEMDNEYPYCDDEIEADQYIHSMAVVQHA